VKAVKILLVVAAVIVVVWVAVSANKRLKAKRALDEANRLYEAAENIEGFEKALGAYRAVLDAGAKGEARRLAEGGVASSEAHIAFLKARTKGSLAGHREALEKMKRAKELPGDPQNIWGPRIATFEKELQEKLGPSIAEMRARLEAGRRQPFAKVVSDLEALLRWRDTWKKEGMHQGDAERERLFQQVREVLRQGYCRQFEKRAHRIRALGDRLDIEALSIKSSLLSMLINVERYDKAAAERYRKTYAAEIAEAEKATKLLNP